MQISANSNSHGGREYATKVHSSTLNFFLNCRNNLRESKIKETRSFAKY